jgi:hypothetical protein
MKTTTPIQTETESAITCDRCQANCACGDAGWSETQSIEFVAG